MCPQTQGELRSTSGVTVLPEGWASEVPRVQYASTGMQLCP
jgi:hypothetical protein